MQKKLLENEKIAVRIALLLIFVWGVAMTFIVPMWQTPDEFTHLTVIGQSWKNDNLANNLMQDMDLEQSRIMGQYDQKVNVELWKSAMAKSPGYSRTDCLPGGVELSALKHLPASIGIWLGILLHLPTFWVLELGEIFALLFAVFIYAIAMKLMPVKKEVLLLIMAFPMTVQQISSINYDSVLLPLCFLFVAYMFYMRMEKQTLGWREAAIALILLGFITYIKMPYVFLGLLIFILPKEKICLRLGRFEINGEVIRKWRIPAAVVIVVLLCAGIYVGRNNQWIQIVLAMVIEWKRGIYLFKATAQTWGKYLAISGIGQFGWLEVSVPIAFACVSYLLLFILSLWEEERESDNGLKLKSRLIIWIVFFILCAFTCMSMINHTIMRTLFGAENAQETYHAREALYQIPYIGGLQGRYFLPFLALPFLAIPGIRKGTKVKMWIVAAYIVIAAILTIRILLGRYWIA